MKDVIRTMDARRRGIVNGFLFKNMKNEEKFVSVKKIERNKIKTKKVIQNFAIF